MKTVMLILAVSVVLCGTIASCKEKNKEEEIEELVEKLGEAKTETEAAEIANKIEKLEERAKKSAKEVNIKMGQAFTFLNEVKTLSDDMTQFSMTFENLAITEETILGERKAGKKYIMILAKTKNLGHRKSFRASSGHDIQVKSDKGYLYRFQSYPGAFPSTFFSSEPPFPLDWKTLDKWQFPFGVLGKSVDIFKESLEPEETGWTIYWTSIPEDSTPVEVFAQRPTEPGRFGGSRRTNFRLKLTQFGGSASERKKETVSPEKEKTKPKSVYDFWEENEKRLRAEPVPVRPKREVSAPKKDVPTPKIIFSNGVFQIGDFSVALSSVEREVSTANLNFVITKTKDTGSEIRPIVVTLTDDHENSYRGKLEVMPYTDFPLRLLPTDFTYVKTVSIVMPKAAPIETIQLGDTKEIYFKQLRLVKPQFKSDIGTTLLKPGESTSVGKFLLFTIDGIVPDLYTWAVTATAENKDYNESSGTIQCAVQLTNGMIAPSETPVTMAIPGLSKKTSRLTLWALRGKEVPQLSRLLIFYNDRSSGQTVLKLWPLSDKVLPPRVGQGADEEIFVEAYQRNDGHELLGDPVGLPHWYAGGTRPKDEHDLLIQEFPENAKVGKSAIVWDKQDHASKAYVLHGPILKKYLEIGGPYYKSKVPGAPFLGAPTSNLRSCKSSFGTEGRYTAFKGGVIFSRTDQAFVVTGKIGEKWDEKNAQLGFPISDARPTASGVPESNNKGWVQRFEGGSIYYITEGRQVGQIFEIHGTIAKVYSEMKAEANWLGFPTTEIYKSIGSKPADQAEFQGGYIGSRDGQKWEAFPYETGRVAFVSNRDGNQEIYVMDADGKNQVNLTNNPADDGSPAWSPDGNKIVFESERSGNWNIYNMDADGSNLRRLTHNELSGSPAWFPDGSKIVFCSVAGKYNNKPVLGIFAMNIDGTNRKLLWRGFGIDPAVSPDGRKIAFSVVDSLHGKTTQMWMMNSDGTGERRVNIGLYSPAGFSWSPSGEAVIFYLPNLWAKDLDLAEGKAIGMTDPRRGRTVWLTNKFGKDPCFSPDEKRIAFSHEGEICIMHITGSLGRKITKDTGGENWDPSWTGLKQGGKTKAVSKKQFIPDKEVSETGIPGKYVLEEIGRDGLKKIYAHSVTIFKEDGTVVLSSSGSEFIIPNQKWKVKNGIVQLYAEGESETIEGRIEGNTIIFRMGESELRYMKQK